MVNQAGRHSSTRLVYRGAMLSIEFYVAHGGTAPAEEWLEQLPLASQQKFAALFVRIGDTGKLWNERKFKHLTGTDKIFEFKVEADRVLCLFFVGKRLILTHGFRKAETRRLKAKLNELRHVSENSSEEVEHEVETKPRGQRVAQ